MQGRIIFELLNIDQGCIRDNVRLFLYNQTLKSKSLRVDVKLQPEPFVLDEVEAMPNGLYDILILPHKYRSKRTFAIVPAGGETTVREVHFLRPDRATAQFPKYSTLSADPQWKKILDATKVSKNKYDEMKKLPKACFFNLCAKMRCQRISGTGEFVIDHLGKVVEFRQERFFALVGRELLSRVRKWPEFETAPGAMHEFFDGWTRIEKNGSYKTTPVDPAGILQLTFATKNGDPLMVDADLDDHKGIQHAFDVIKHQFSGETHPYDIHQILRFFQGIDPGYSLS